MARGLLLGVSGAPAESLGAQDYDASENLAVDSGNWRVNTPVLRGVYGPGGACPRRDVPARGGGSAMTIYVFHNGENFVISADSDPCDDFPQNREQATAEVLMAIGFWEDK